VIVWEGVAGRSKEVQGATRVSWVVKYLYGEQRGGGNIILELLVLICWLLVLNSIACGSWAGPAENLWEIDEMRLRGREIRFRPVWSIFSCTTFLAESTKQMGWSVFGGEVGLTKAGCGEMRRLGPSAEPEWPGNVDFWSLFG